MATDPVMAGPTRTVKTELPDRVIEALHLALDDACHVLANDMYIIERFGDVSSSINNSRAEPRHI